MLKMLVFNYALPIILIKYNPIKHLKALFRPQATDNWSAYLSEEKKKMESVGKKENSIHNTTARALTEDVPINWK